jgi:DNA-binding LacI/PurR family transcriptional regulator
MPTQKQLAKLAGVSAGTVSNVISGSTSVSEASRKKVLDAIKALNYEPNLIARSLKTRRTNTIGIVVPDITIPFFPKVIRGAESAARERGYFVLVLDSQRSHELELDMMALLRQRVDGILLVTAGDYKWSAESAAQIIAGPPIVCVDRLPNGLDVDSVCVDDRSAADLGVSHLLSLGHTDIAIVTGPLTLKNERERLRGYKSALRRAGLPERDSLIWSSSFDAKDIDEACRKGLISAATRPSALFATNGVTGLGALRTIYAMGLSTPKDIVFATFDEVTVEELFQPGITSVVQPTHEIGYRAVEVLLDRIAMREPSSERTHVRLAATLVVRQSTGQAVRHAP